MVIAIIFIETGAARLPLQKVVLKHQPVFVYARPAIVAGAKRVIREGGEIGGVIRRAIGRKVGDGPIRTLVNIMRVTILINLLMVVSEVVVEFYTGGTHTSAAHYLYFGLHGHHAGRVRQPDRQRGSIGRGVEARRNC